MKKLFIIIVFILLSFGLYNASVAVGVAPSYEDNFANYLLKSDGDSHGTETVYDLGIKKDRTLAYNIRCLFYPNSLRVPGCDEGVSSGGKLWDVVRYLGVALFFLFMVIIGINLLMSDPKDPDNFKKAMKSLYYVALGGVIFFGGTRILGSVISFDTIQQGSGLAESLHSGPDSLLFKVISFLKAFTFFLAIILIIVHGFRIMSSLHDIEKVKTQAKGIFHILIILALIKVIDYAYFIASQPDFASRGSELIIEIAKIIGFIIGFIALAMIFYAGFLLFTDQGSTEKMTKAKNIIVNILLIAIVIFVFLLILFQIFKEFG